VTTQFNITVTDVNDAPTNITLSPHTIKENAPSGTFIGILSAVDGDVGDSANFTYGDSGVAVVIFMELYCSQDNRTTTRLAQ